MKVASNISLAFTGGAIGAFIDSFNIWFIGKIGISDLIGITMKPEFTAPWIYRRVVWPLSTLKRARAPGDVPKRARRMRFRYESRTLTSWLRRLQTSRSTTTSHLRPLVRVKRVE